MTSGSAQGAGLKLPPLSFLRAQTSKEAADSVLKRRFSEEPPPLRSQTREVFRWFSGV